MTLRCTEELTLPGSSHLYLNRNRKPKTAGGAGAELEPPTSLVAAAERPLWNSNPITKPLHWVWVRWENPELGGEG